MVNPAHLDEASARRWCLLQACEDGPPDAALWSPEDATWASRLADETAGPEASDAAWLAERARHAEQRLLPRRATLARAFARGIRVRQFALWAAVGGLAFGVAADLVGRAQLVDLLAAPVWAVVGWNVLVYAWIVLQGLRGLGISGAVPRPAGPLRRAGRRWLTGAAAPLGALAGKAGRTPEQRFAVRWAEVAAPLAADRAAALLHLAAAALALGLVAGLYARALVLDYRVGWQSTLLDPAQVHAALSVLLAPASALTGLPVPDAQAVAALRLGAGGVAAGATGNTFGAAAHWVHLLAATLGWAVVLPRLVLALRAALVARWRARRLPVTLDDAATLRRLASRRRHAGAASRAPSVQVLPHGFTPPPAATLGLQRVVAACFGEGVVLHVAEPTAYGDEDHAPGAPPEASSGAPAGRAAWRIAWFDLAATPEAQVQGRFAAQPTQAPRGAPQAASRRVWLVDESRYRQRMGAGSPRLAERRRAWQALAEEVGVPLACVDLEAVAAEAAAAPGGVPNTSSDASAAHGAAAASPGDALAAARAALEAALDVAEVAP